MKSHIGLWRLLFILVLLSPLLAADKSCSRDVVCFITEKQEYGIDLYIEVLKPFEITITTEATLENMVSTMPLPYTETFPGKQKRKLLSFKIADKTKTWHYHYNYFWTFGSLYGEHDNSYIYTLPYEPQRSFKVSQGFNGKFSHNGDNQYAIDWAMPLGTPVYAAREGIVVGAEDRYSEGGADVKFRDYANYIMIKHADGTIGEYDHFQKGGVKVRIGQKVKAGQFIGLSGSVGFSSGPHLHFFVYKAINGRQRLSFPIRFKAVEGMAIILVEGKYYTALATGVAKPPGQPSGIPANVGTGQRQ